MENFNKTIIEMINHLCINHLQIAPSVGDVSRNALGVKEISGFEFYKYLLKNKSGIEVGGPSPIFNNKLPIYSVIKHLDCVNFSSSTIWEGTIDQGSDFYINGIKIGNHFIAEANQIFMARDKSYEFVLSSNCLEHLANPISAIIEWARILKSSGYLILVLPNKISNFDHKRKVTSFEHLLNDYKNNITEDDLTHLSEILTLHDLSLDPAAGTTIEFENRSKNNFQNRCLHHHVFDNKLAFECLEFCGFNVIHSFESFTDLYFFAELNN